MSRTRRLLVLASRAVLGVVVLYILLYHIAPVLLIPSRPLREIVLSIRDDVFIAGTLLILGLALRSAIMYVSELSRGITILYLAHMFLICTSVLLIVAVMETYMMSLSVHARCLVPLSTLVAVMYNIAQMLPLGLTVIAIMLPLALGFSSNILVVSIPVLAGTAVYAASSYTSGSYTRKRGSVRAGLLAGTLALILIVYLMVRPVVEHVRPTLAPILDVSVLAVSAYLLFETIASIAYARSQSVSVIEQEIERELHEEPEIRDKLREYVEEVYRRFIIWGDKKPLIKFIATSGASDHILDKALEAVLNYEDPPIPSLLPGLLKKIYVKRNIACRIALLSAIVKLLAEGKCTVSESFKSVPRRLLRYRRTTLISAVMLVIVSVALALYSLYLSLNGVSAQTILPLCETAILLSTPVPLLISLSSSGIDNVRQILQKICSES